MCCSGIILLGTQEPQMSYWQRFKNWINETFWHKKNTEASLTQEIKRVKQEIKGLSKQEQIKMLQQMYKESSLEGKNPDEVTLNAIDVIRAELSKEK